MILGVGTDLLDIRRIERTLERFGDRFCERVFTEIERARCEGHVARAARYAQRYAAKEACSKALGTGFRDGVAWRGIGVDNLPSGKPFLTLTGGARERLEKLTPAGMTAFVEVSLSDEYPMAQAVVVISALPQRPDESRGADADGRR
ncbi:MAG: holo-ACP synthase [Rhodospirillales bacterium]|jgi:holo-[acyl-carrier protein] synthase|nr:holo-ACP synthase [Rhodospirillales bacterium]